MVVVILEEIQEGMSNISSFNLSIPLLTAREAVQTPLWLRYN